VPAAGPARPFAFDRDTVVYANELVWEYYRDEGGQWRHRANPVPPTYAQRCFVVARTVKQFFNHARFEPGWPKADAWTYRGLVRSVIERNPRTVSAELDRIVVPGYEDLREFSRDQRALLQAECGGAWESYVQRGHWRMVFPFSRSGQARVAGRLLESGRLGRPVVVHLVCFPSLTLNHAVLVYGVEERDGVWKFLVYDPNQPEAPTQLWFDRGRRTFEFPENRYFEGGAVNVYEVYDGVCD
jgi:hypothetical protein